MIAEWLGDGEASPYLTVLSRRSKAANCPNNSQTVKNASHSDKGNEELSSEEHNKSYISGQTDTESNGNSKRSKLHHVNG